MQVDPDLYNRASETGKEVRTYGYMEDLYHDGVIGEKQNAYDMSLLGMMFGKNYEDMRSIINASLNKSWNCLFKGSIVGESKIIDTVNGILKYYMDIDSDYRRNNKSDSITNHVDEAFEKRCDDHKQKEFHFDRRA